LRDQARGRGHEQIHGAGTGPHGIRINTVCPTFIRALPTQSSFDNPDRRVRIGSTNTPGRVAQVEDVMGAVLYRASDASALVPGTAHSVDGGWTTG